LDFNAYDEMLAGEPDAGNPHVRFDEGEQRGRQSRPLLSTLPFIRGSVFFLAPEPGARWVWKGE